MFTISSQSDYGLIILSNLVGRKDFVSLTELVKNTNLPIRFLARIAAELAKQGLLESKEGRVGGYKALDKINEISLYDYLTIFERDIEVTKCCEADYSCEHENICQHHGFLQNKLNKILTEQLKRIKLIEVFN